MPKAVSQAPRFVIPLSPRGINIPEIPKIIKAPAKISENQVQYFTGL